MIGGDAYENIWSIDIIINALNVFNSIAYFHKIILIYKSKMPILLAPEWAGL